MNISYCIKSLPCNSCNKHKNNMQTSPFLSIKHVFVMGWINQLCCRGSRLQGVMYICIRTHLALLLRLLSFSLMKVPQYPFTVHNWLYTYWKKKVKALCSLCSQYRDALELTRSNSRTASCTAASFKALSRSCMPLELNILFIDLTWCGYCTAPELLWVM